MHHSKSDKVLVAEREDKIKLFYLPSYSQELNPEVRRNVDLKHAIGFKAPSLTKAKLKTAATKHTTKLEQSPDQIKSFFQSPRV